ncbi:uncharacterized protein LOC141666056 [Apium graveolens]|uniref:uncharacterized protein LOC141666056 n=1 Tax=Apium graveolens TaxID=4045 RepID=UPI003D797E22
MRFASWNVHGLKKSPHQDELLNFISLNNIEFMGILETKVKVDKAASISKKINKKWAWIFNYDYHYNGRVWVGWNSTIWNVSLCSTSAQHITCNATLIDNDISFLVSYVYAFNDACDRVPLWTNLNQLSSTLSPWCILGDFNCTIALEEGMGGKEHFTPDMQVFKNCITSNGLGEVRTLGDNFTWYNKRPNNPIFKRLDRMLGNSHWFLKFTEGNVYVKNRGIMDHNPLFYEDPLHLQKIRKPFQFFNFMLHLPGFLDVVRQASTPDCHGEPMTILIKKLQVTKKALRVFNKAQGNVHSNVHEGLLVTGHDKCADVAVDYFQQILGPSTTQHVNIDLSGFDAPVLIHNQLLSLEMHVTNSIILKTLKSIKKKKSLGPDGFNVEFFLASCEVTDECFFEATKAFFASGSLHPGISSNFISLIPKVLAPTRMQDFRPISLCMVAYKCISKVLAARLKAVMPFIVHQSQSAFIPGRSISDNILMAHELFWGYDREIGVPRCALKIDLRLLNLNTIGNARNLACLTYFSQMTYFFLLVRTGSLLACCFTNGASTSLWFDPWWNHGLASSSMSPIIRQYGLQPDAKGGSCNHLFLHCTYIRILVAIFSQLRILDFGHIWVDFLLGILAIDDWPRRLIALCYAQVFYYHIWRERNACTHDKGVFDPKKLLQGIVLDIRARLSANSWFSRLACNRPDLIISVV